MLGAWQYDQQSAFQGIAVHFFAFFAFFDAFLVAEAPRCLCLEGPPLRQNRTFLKCGF
jgi:hypothetical protein